MMTENARADLLTAVQVAERLRFDSIWVMDSPLRDVPTLDPLATLAYAAAGSQRLGIGTAVLISTPRAPVQLAADLASIDQLSAGRLIVGLGLGGNPDILGAYGISERDRSRRFELGVKLLKAWWAGDPVGVDQDLWQVGSLVPHPLPFQRPRPPIWIGASQPASIQRAVQIADGWIGAGSIALADFGNQLRTTNELLTQEARPSQAFTIAKRMYLHVSDAPDAPRRAREWFQVFYGDGNKADICAIVGPPSRCSETLIGLRDAGVDLVIANVMFDHISQFEILANLVAESLGTHQEASTWQQS